MIDLHVRANLAGLADHDAVPWSIKNTEQSSRRDGCRSRCGCETTRRYGRAQERDLLQIELMSSRWTRSLPQSGDSRKQPRRFPRLPGLRRRRHAHRWPADAASWAATPGTRSACAVGEGLDVRGPVLVAALACRIVGHTAFARANCSVRRSCRPSIRSPMVIGHIPHMQVLAAADIRGTELPSDPERSRSSASAWAGTVAQMIDLSISCSSHDSVGQFGQTVLAAEIGRHGRSQRQLDIQHRQNLQKPHPRRTVRRTPYNLSSGRGLSQSELPSETLSHSSWVDEFSQFTRPELYTRTARCGETSELSDHNACRTVSICFAEPTDSPELRFVDFRSAKERRSRRHQA